MPYHPPDAPWARPVRVVLDTNCSLALFLWEDPRCAGLRARIDAGLELPTLDPPCLEEWQRVLQSAFADRPPDERKQAMARYAHRLALVQSQPVLGLPRCRDPDDQKFLTLAASVGASILYTRDRDLLRLRGIAQKRCRLCITTPDDAPC